LIKNKKNFVIGKQIIYRRSKKSWESRFSFRYFGNNHWLLVNDLVMTSLCVGAEYRPDPKGVRERQPQVKILVFAPLLTRVSNIMDVYWFITFDIGVFSYVPIGKGLLNIC
jgi:hypothetical protein